MNISLLKHSLLLICLLVFSNNIFSNDKLATENCIIHLDKSFYVTGEVMWYKMYLPKSFDKQAVTLKVSLLDKLGSTKHYSFHKTDGKTYFSSHYKVPFDIQSGIYNLIVSGIKSSTGTTIKLAEIAIPIYNDLETVRIAKTDLANPNNLLNNVPTISDNPLKVNIELDKSSYSNREKVNVIIKVTDANGNPVQGNCSVAVTDNQLAGDNAYPYNGVLGGILPQNILSKNLNNSIHVRGMFLDKESKPKKVEIMGVFSAHENEFIFTKSKDNGEFFIEMPNYSGSKPIQFVNHYAIDDELKIQFSEDAKKELQQDFVYTEGIINYLKLSRERKKIFQMFEGFEANIKAVPTKFTKKKLNPNKEYNLRNYSTFENVPMFFKEVLTYLKFKKDGQKFIAQITNPTPSWEAFYPGKPFFIIDGKITRDADFVARMEYSHIEQIDLFFDSKDLKNQFNIMGKSGAATITTDLPKILLPEADEKRIFTVNGLQPKAEFPVFETSQVNDNNRLPFFRPQLYWNPDVMINPNGEGRFSFTQTDDESTFKVHVLVQDANGKMGYGDVIYEVEMR